MKMEPDIPRLQTPSFLQPHPARFLSSRAPSYVKATPSPPSSSIFRVEWIWFLFKAVELEVKGRRMMREVNNLSWGKQKTLFQNSWSFQVELAREQTCCVWQELAGTWFVLQGLLRLRRGIRWPPTPLPLCCALLAEFSDSLFSVGQNTAG